ncbi:MAG TPA: hypothetical protein PLO31_07580 [Dysgonamonadaceae bacterium]|nr:hypothetical protein [Dysgonamonadaceae bacterium]
MSELQNKSEINYESARYLHDRGNYPSVAHCAYYSCYQLLLHIWFYSLMKSGTDLNFIINKHKGNKAQIKGSHETLINEIQKYIKENNYDDFRVINKSIGQLRKLRISADYEDNSFLYNDSLKAIELSKRIRPILKKY